MIDFPTKKGTFGHRHTHTLGGSEDEGRDAYKPGNTKDSANHQKPGERPGTDSPPWPLDGTNPANTLTLDFQAPKR